MAPAANGREPRGLHGTPLTPRERQVLDLMRAGATNGDIGAALSISLGTVKTHVAHILARLDVDNRIQASAKTVCAHDGGKCWHACDYGSCYRASQGMALSHPRAPGGSVARRFLAAWRRGLRRHLAP